MKIILSAEARAKNWHDEPRAYYQFDDCEVCLVESTVEDGKYPELVVAWHVHNFPEILLCMGGQVTAQVLGHTDLVGDFIYSVDLGEGDLVYFEAGEKRRVLRTHPGAKLIAIKLGSPVRE